MFVKCVLLNLCDHFGINCRVDVSWQGLTANGYLESLVDFLKKFVGNPRVHVKCFAVAVDIPLLDEFLHTLMNVAGDNSQPIANWVLDSLASFVFRRAIVVFMF